MAIGAGGVILVQERYLPPRLSAEQSSKLQTLLESTERERARLAGELAASAGRIEAAAVAQQAASEELASLRRKAEQHRSDIASLLEALPPDPRGGTIEVRAASFEAGGGKLDYHVVLSRAKTGGKPFSGVMQFVVAGSRSGADQSITLKPIDVSFSDYDSLRGSLPLPEGFDPRQTTVRILDRAGGQQLGMRVLYVK